MEKVNEILRYTVSFRELALAFFLFLPGIFAIMYFLVRHAVRAEFKKRKNE